MDGKQDYIQQLIAEFDKEVPHLKESMEELYQLQEQFVSDFNREKLASMTLEEYSLGRGADGKDNFCHRLEIDLDELGSMRGISSEKFGVWSSIGNGDYKISRTFKKKHKDDYDQAFEEVRELLVDLYDAGKNEDIAAISSNILHDWLKGKLLSIYFPDRYLNIFDRGMLKKCCDALGIELQQQDSVYLRECLYEYYKENETTKNWPLNLFGAFLWTKFRNLDASTLQTEPRMNLEELFKRYLSECVRNNDKKIKVEDLQMLYSDVTVNSYINGIRKINNKFNLNVFEINSSKEIIDKLSEWVKDADFIKLDNGNSNNSSNALKHYYFFLKARELFMAEGAPHVATPTAAGTQEADMSRYLNALRTKPFMLLAGISGTGKSRIVRELAYRCCPDEDDLRSDSTTPGNYLMVEVKPNWHDSSELKGYYSNISQKYILTPFIKFLVKAKKYPHVPFFVCLDEMNLAPVEQYFAEFLSIIETRRLKGDKLTTGVFVEKKYLTELGEAEDLTIPANVFVIGTVNMDDTTHQFSRKVIDRAMTIEMNGGKLEDMFGGSTALSYSPQSWSMDKELKVQYVTADEVLAAHPKWADSIKQQLVLKLNEVNACLNGTPFEVSYRVLNELVIYLGVLLDNEEPTTDDEFDDLVARAVDQILLMKVLPRIEGEEELFALTEEEQKVHPNVPNKLAWLQDICPNIEVAEGEMTAKKKIAEMLTRLNNGFTRFWP